MKARELAEQELGATLCIAIELAAPDRFHSVLRQLADCLVAPNPQKVEMCRGCKNDLIELRNEFAA